MGMVEQKVAEGSRRKVGGAGSNSLRSGRVGIQFNGAVFPRLLLFQLASLKSSVVAAT